MPWKLTRPAAAVLRHVRRQQHKVAPVAAFTGRFATRCESTACETSVFCTSRIWLAASTSTVVVAVLTLSARSMVSVWPTRRVMSLLLYLAEVGRGRVYRVVTRQQERRGVDAGTVGLIVVGNARVYVGHGHRSPRDDCLGGIGYGSIDGACARRLRYRGNAGEWPRRTPPRPARRNTVGDKESAFSCLWLSWEGVLVLDLKWPHGNTQLKKVKNGDCPSSRA